MPLYRKRPMTVDAMQFSEEGDNAEAVVTWALKRKLENPFNQDTMIFILQVPADQEGQFYHEIATRTADGQILTGGAGSFVIRGEGGEFHITDPETFNRIYEPLILQ